MQSPLQSDGCYPLASIIPVNEEARDPPIRKVGETIEIGSLILDVRKLGCRPELTPADGGGAVVHKGGVSPAFLDSPFLLSSILQRGPVSESSLEVKGHAPAATPYAVVFLDESSKIRPRRFVQRLGGEVGQDPPLLGRRCKPRARTFTGRSCSSYGFPVSQRMSFGCSPERCGEGAGSGLPSETLILVGPPGLEPGSAGYEPGALPLSYGPHGIIT